jgi:hypothetical protein
MCDVCVHVCDVWRVCLRDVCVCVCVYMCTCGSKQGPLAGTLRCRYVMCVFVMCVCVMCVRDVCQCLTCVYCLVHLGRDNQQALNLTALPRTRTDTRTHTHLHTL